MNATRDFTFVVSEIVEGVDAAHRTPWRWATRTRRSASGDLQAGMLKPVRRGVQPGRPVRRLVGQRPIHAQQDQPSKVVFFLPLVVAMYLTGITVYIACGERLPGGGLEQ